MKTGNAALLLLSCAVVNAAAFENGGFEAGLDNWRFWTRDADAGALELDEQVFREGKRSGRIQHRGDQDWSLEPGEPLACRRGELFELEIWTRVEGEGNAILCASTWDPEGKVVDWMHAERAAEAGVGWQHLRTRVLVPDGITRLQPRLVGYGPATIWLDGFAVRKLANPMLAARGELPLALSITNRYLAVTLVTSNATLVVRDHRTGREWKQLPLAPGIMMNDAAVSENRLELALWHGALGIGLKGTIRMVPEEPEFTFELDQALPTGSGGTGSQDQEVDPALELRSPIRFPHPFEGAPGEYLVVPMNEGISYPVEDETVPLHRFIAYGGHGICMAFWGVTDGSAGHMAIIETPDDAAIQLSRKDGKLLISPEWDPQKQRFGYARKLRYVFFDRGGHVAIAKRYRDYARELGLVKTLEEKKRFNPNVDLLVGAVNVWCWDKDAVSIVKEMKAAGIERILWSNRQTPENLRALNDLGVLTSRYDIYQDVMDPAQFPKLRWTHPDWTTAAWPQDIIIDRRGQHIKGWGVEAKDGSMIYCGVLCDKRAPDCARERIPPELESHPYKSRFIDTTTASPWRECYDSRHPMTRTESKRWKMELLRYVSEDLKLVTGCETGHDASVPFLHYFEGMLSLGPYRVPDAGRRMNVIWTNVPDVVAKYQLGHKYRLPLWELVFHDCTVAQWYWGDYNNKLPALWDKRDLFNVLYGTPPMFMFDLKSWRENKARFVQSYVNTCPHVRQSGYAEMTDHRFLTPNRDVQQTAFANGQKVTVNFGSEPYRGSNGLVLAPMACKVDRPE